jgi:hypothetical protein
MTAKGTNICVTEQTKMHENKYLVYRTNHNYKKNKKN